MTALGRDASPIFFLAPQGPSTHDPTPESSQRIDISIEKRTRAGSCFARNVTPPRRQIRTYNQRDKADFGGVTVGRDFTATQQLPRDRQVVDQLLACSKGSVLLHPLTRIIPDHRRQPDAQIPRQSAAPGPRPVLHFPAAGSTRAATQCRLILRRKVARRRTRTFVGSHHWARRGCA